MGIRRGISLFKDVEAFAPQVVHRVVAGEQAGWQVAHVPRGNGGESTLPSDLGSQQPGRAGLRAETEESGSGRHGPGDRWGWYESDPLGLKPATVRGTQVCSNGVKELEERPWGHVDGAPSPFGTPDAFTT